MTLEQAITKTYEDVEHAYNAGCVSQDVWEQYNHIWQTSYPGHQHLVHGYADGPCSNLCKCSND